MKSAPRAAFLLPFLATTLSIASCGGREEVWESPAEALVAHAFDDAAVLVDTSGERALVLAVEEDLTLSPTSIPIGRGLAAAAMTADRKTLAVLTRGDVPREKPDDQGPSLALIQAGAKPAVLRSYELGDPLSGLSLDPESRFAIIYPSASDYSFVANPNELSIVDLTAPGGETNPVPLTLRSFGGRPQSFVFTPELGLPAGARRLLAVLTDRDVGIIDLAAPELGDITVRLSSTGERKVPAQVVYSDGDPEVSDDARLAVRVEGDPNVILIDLLAASTTEATAHDFRPTPNLVYAGGVPTDVSFVNTDGGLRLAALVPSKSAMTLIDPSTGIPGTVELGAPFEKMTIVTSIVGASEKGADAALLWSSSSPMIGFVALGSTVGKPYKAVERLELTQPIAAVLDIPAPNDHLRLLRATDGQNYFVLDLVSRTASLITASVGTEVTIAPDGLRAWMTADYQSAIAALDLESKHPRSLILQHPAIAAFDITRRGGGRALVAVHPATNYGITVLDGIDPALETAVSYPSVLLGDLQ